MFFSPDFSNLNYEVYWNDDKLESLLLKIQIRNFNFCIHIIKKTF